MMNRDIFKKAFENVKPPEELVKSVLEFQNAPAVPKKTKRRSFFGKYRRAALIALCGLMVCGCTAAATNVIKFGELFGVRFLADDKDFADSLMGTVKDFSYKVSDEDYKISVKGITGTDEGYFAVAEISRVDGEPVADHFVNPMELSADSKNYLCLNWTEQDFGDWRGFAGVDAYVNSEKNIEMYICLNEMEHTTNNKVVIRGENFYPFDKYWDFTRENEVIYVRYEQPTKFSGYVDVHRNASVDFVPVDFDDSSIIALDLEWEISFTPVASKNAEKGKKVKKFDEDFIYLENVYDVSDGFSFVTEVERVLTPTAIDVKALGTDIEYTFTLTDSEYEYGDKYFISDDNINNKISLIFKDGSTLAASMESNQLSGNDSGTAYTGKMHIIYQDFSVENSKPAVVDVKDVKAISINGTVYTVK